MATPLIVSQVTRWAAYPSSQVLLRVCQEPFRPLLLVYYLMPLLYENIVCLSKKSAEVTNVTEAI